MAPLDPISDPGDSQHDGHEHGSNGAHTNGAAASNGTLAKLSGNNLPSVSTLNWSYGPPPRPEILSSKPNPVELLHAVRRRWPLALGLGLTFGTAVAALVWFLMPVKYEAYALIKIRGNPQTVLESVHTPADEFDLFKATQEQLILQSMVLNGVLREASINRLPSVQEHSDDPVDWLKGELMINFPGDAEVMRIAIKTKSKNDSLAIVDKVVEVYIKEVVQYEKTQRMADEAKLTQAYEQKAADYKRELDSLVALERIHKTSGSEAAQLKKKMAIEELNMLMADRSRIIEQMHANSMESTLLATRMQNATVSVPDVIIDAQLDEDPAIAPLKQQLVAYQDQLSRVRGVAANADSTAYMAELQREILRLDETINDLKHERRPRLLELYQHSAGQANSQYALSPEQLETQRKLLELRLAEADEKIQQKTEEVSGLESFSAQVTAKKEELDAMRLMKNQLSSKVEKLRIERLSPDRITPIDKAVLEGNGDALKKYIAVVFLFLLTFVGTLLGVAVLEFQSRKVNSVKEVNDGLGIRVVGELPNIGGRAFRRVRGGKGQAVLKALMSERIDGTRTALIHTTAIDPPRVVMVTSAEPHEGKTTTSTQLAASLARSGRRTLIIDADIRNPGVHRVFEMPQEPGLSELLRNEADRDAVIHPTRTANLWLMPAGRCDLRSVQALSGSYLGSAIAALSVQFDYVIIDAGPVLKVADPLLVGQHADAAIISVLKDVSKVPNVYEAVERLRSVGITVLGSVVNGVKDDVARHGMELLMADKPRQETAASSTS